MIPLACSLAFLLGSMSATAAPAAPQEPPAKARPARKKIDKSPAKRVVPEREVKITSDSFEVIPADKQARWKGNVVVLRDDLRVQCASLLADYDDQNRLKKLTCSGGAYLHQSASPPRRPEREVWGEVAVFDQDTGLLTVTGAPHGREGDNTLQGEKVTFDSAADKLRVERATVVIQTVPDQASATTSSKPAQEPSR